MSEHASAELVERWRQGDEEAAAQLFRRFAHRLIGLAASRLSKPLGRRVDPEDVVQSAYRSFFSAARKGEFTLNRSGDLWKLLVSITLHKLQKQAERHAAGKRALAQERQLDGPSENAFMELVTSREPSPLEAATLVEDVQNLLRQLEPHQRPILELRLQGFDHGEISDKTELSERTVRRTLGHVKKLLEKAASL